MAPTSGSDLLAAAEAEELATIAEAEAEAQASGKEPFAMARVETLMGVAPGELDATEHELRLKYYVLEPELRTLVELVALLQEARAWD